MVAGGAAVVELHDIFAETYGFANHWVRQGYLSLINRAPRAWARIYQLARSTTGLRLATCGCFFKRRIALSQLLCASSRPWWFRFIRPIPHLFDAIFGGAAGAFPERGLHYRLDHGERDLASLRERSLFVPNEQTAAVLAQAGVPDEKVRSERISR